MKSKRPLGCSLTYLQANVFGCVQFPLYSSEVHRGVDERCVVGNFFHVDGDEKVFSLLFSEHLDMWGRIMDIKTSLNSLVPLI